MCYIIRSLCLLLKRKKTYVDELEESEPFIENDENDYFSDEESYNEHLKVNMVLEDIKDGTVISNNLNET